MRREDRNFVFADNASSGPGVYTITNVPSGRVYVGASVNVRRRMSAHVSALARHCHENRSLQRDHFYGSDRDFVFALVEVCEVSTLREREWLVIQRMQDSGIALYNGRDWRVMLAQRLTRPVDVVPAGE